MGKTFNQKNFHYFFWTHFSSRVSIYIIFFRQAHFKLSATLAKLVPPVLFTPVVHLDLQISPRIFEKIWNGLNGILLGWGGKLIHEKKPEA
jgi:hypothetical protein